MGKYNIVSKYPKGNPKHHRTNSKVGYLVEGSSKVHYCDMVYLDVWGLKKYAFLEKTKKAIPNTHCGYYGIVDNDDATEFVEEITKFQKGGSYRKTHPLPDDIEY